VLPASQLLPSPQPTTAFASAGYRLPWGLREVLVLYWGPIVATLLATIYPAVASVAQAALSDPSAPLRTAAPCWLPQFRRVIMTATLAYCWGRYGGSGFFTLRVSGGRLQR
jgi:hypothetical protein